MSGAAGAPSKQRRTPRKAGKKPQSAASPAPSRPLRSLLRPLGVMGYDAVEPALLAALANEEPLLLMSEHGAAKTFLLIRLAEALGLELRHYNASLLQFDDLAGFPIPDEEGGIRYAAPPGAIWGSEVVFLDEIGRCRPDMANKLFPIVHERRIQGVLLDRLRYRWAATNPPAEAEDGESRDIYEGVEPLDPALADRFTWVVRLPAWRELPDTDRAAIVRGIPDRVSADAAGEVRGLVEGTRALLPEIEREWGETAVEYVLALAPALEKAGVRVGGRRASMLRRAVLGVSAACVALGRSTGEDAFMTGLRCAIPDVVRRPVRPSALAAAHAEAWCGVTRDPSEPEMLVMAVKDPVRRVALALDVPGLGAAIRGEVVTSSLAGLAPMQKEILAWHLLPRLAADEDVPAPAVEAVAEVLDTVVNGDIPVEAHPAASQWIAEFRTRAACWSGAAGPSAGFLFSVLVRTYPDPYQSTPTRVCIDAHFAKVTGFWTRCTKALGAVEGS